MFSLPCSETENVSARASCAQRKRSIGSPHTRLEQPIEKGETPSPCARLPLFARCVLATSVPRKSNHRREAAAVGVAAAISPDHPPQGAGSVAGTDVENAQHCSE